MKIIRTSTIGLSLNVFCKGLFKELSEEGYEMIALSSPDNDLKEVQQREGIKTIAVEMNRRISPFKDLKSLYRLIKVFQKEKPVMVHSITPKAGLLSMIAAKVTKVPVRLHTFTGLLFPTSCGFRRKLLLTTDKITCFCASHIMAESQGVKADLINNSVSDKEISILGYGNLRGIDMNHYDRTPEVIEKADEIKQELLGNHDISGTAGSQPFIFIFCGRFAKDKGIEYLIDSFSELVNAGRDLKLIMVGDFDSDDPLTPEVIDYIKNSKNILWSGGWVNDVRPYFAASDALVFPSKREGCPNVVIEAGAMGLPSVVTDINGSREIITDSLNGKIVPPNDSKSLTKAMRYLIENKDETSKMALSARKIIAERYEQKFVRNNLKNYYKKILNL